MRTPYKANTALYDAYYKQQVGHGLPVYIGGLRGKGLGGILNGLLRTAVPLLKSGAKTLLREGAKGGLQVAQDVLSGQNVKAAVKRRAKGVGKNLLNKAIGEFIPPPAPPGEPAVKRIRRPTTKRKRAKRQRDIFG